METVLCAIVRDHLEAFLVHARESYERALPRYVEQAFRAYLTCGVFAHGFLRLHCDACHRDLLVAFTCQGRGICPSCAARRMANTAAHIVDRVLPAVPVRQWVLSLPFELRRLAAFRADVTRALGRIFIESVALEQKRTAGITGGRHAAVNHTQRFGKVWLILWMVLIQLLSHASSAPDIAKLLRVHLRTIHRWRQRFSGPDLVATLADALRSGRPRSLSTRTPIASR